MNKNNKKHQMLILYKKLKKNLMLKNNFYNLKKNIKYKL